MESLAGRTPRLRIGQMALAGLAVEPATVCAAAGSALAAAAFAWLALLRYATFNATAYDLGFFDQVVWEIARGRPGLTSYTYFYDFFGQHLEPVLYLFGALYRVWADPRLLLICQAVAAGAAGWLLYRCAQQVLGPWRSAALSAAFLLAVPLHTALAFDFHPEVMSGLAVFGGLLLALRGRAWTAAAVWGTLLPFKEDESLFLPGLALLLFLLTRRKAAALALGGAGVLWAVLALGVIEPHWRHGYAGDLTQQYAAFGTSLGAAITTLVSRPLFVAGLAFGNGGAAALLHWIAGTGFAAVLAPLGLAASAPDLLLQLASSHPPQHVLHLHYGVEAVPVVFAFLVAELGWLRRRPYLRDGLIVAVSCSALAAFALASPFRSGLPYGAPSAAHLDALTTAVRLIPPAATLRADSTLAAHLSQREHIQEFPGSDFGRYVAVDTTAFHTDQSRQYGYSTALAALPGQGYTKIYDQEGVQVWKR